MDSIENWARHVFFPDVGGDQLFIFNNSRVFFCKFARNSKVIPGEFKQQYFVVIEKSMGMGEFLEMCAYFLLSVVDLTARII